MKRFALALAIGAMTSTVTGAGVASASTNEAHVSQTVLNVVGWKGGGSEIANIPQINADFEAAYPSIKLNYTYVSATNYQTYMDTRLAGGSAADVFMTDNVFMDVWQKQGYLEDLSSQPWVSRIDPALNPLDTVGGKYYQFIQEDIGDGLYVNLDLLKQAGISGAPQSWPQFISDLKTLKAKGINGLLMTDEGGWSSDNMALMLSASTVFRKDPNWNAQFNAGTAHFNPSWAPVVNDMRQLFTDGLVNPQLMLGLSPWSDGLELFQGGNWAFSVQGAWELTGFLQNIHFHMAFVPFPGNSAGTQPEGLTYVGTGLAVNAASKNIPAAEAYVNFWSQQKALRLYDESENAFPTVSGVSVPLVPEAAAFQKAYNSGRTIKSPAQSWTNPDGELYESNIMQELLVNPKTSTTKILDQLDKQVYEKAPS
jgi:raffinose/stachyose/melibiose transport system substrate-binding protein